MVFQRTALGGSNPWGIGRALWTNCAKFVQLFRSTGDLDTGVQGSRKNLRNAICSEKP